MRAGNGAGVSATCTATLQRIWSNRFGTFGRLSTDHFNCLTLEPPWRDNEPYRSCIPAGAYELERFDSEHVAEVLPHVQTFRLRGVSDRSSIMIHHGSTVIDTDGCILVGHDVATLHGRWAVSDSVNTLSRLLTCNIVQLTIREPAYRPNSMASSPSLF